MLEVISRELIPEASFSQAHSSLSQWILRCSLVALLALILCEVLLIPMNKGNSSWQDKPGRARGKNQEKGLKTSLEFWGRSRREIFVIFWVLYVDHRSNFLRKCRTIVHADFRARKEFFVRSSAPDFAPVLAQLAEFPFRSLSALEAPRNRRTLEAQRLLGTPLPLSPRAIPCRPGTRCGTKVLRTNIFSPQNFTNALPRGRGTNRD